MPPYEVRPAIEGFAVHAADGKVVARVEDAHTPTDRRVDFCVLLTLAEITELVKAVSEAGPSLPRPGEYEPKS